MSDIKTDPKTYLRRAVILKKTHSTSKSFLPVVAPNIHQKKEIYIGRPIVTRVAKSDLNSTEAYFATKKLAPKNGPISDCH